ncbi:hypothetical protein ACROYT_G041490 [Oculina patagonica]
MLSKRRTNTFVFVALLIVTLLAGHSQGIMGWFGGKKPNGRRSIIKLQDYLELNQDSNATHRPNSKHVALGQKERPGINRRHHRKLAVLGRHFRLKMEE